MAWSIILRGETELDVGAESKLLHETFPDLVKSLRDAGLNPVSGNASAPDASSMNVDEVTEAP